MNNTDDRSIQLTRDEAKQLLGIMGFKRDYGIISNKAEYYLKPTYPLASFHVPKHRELSTIHSLKLLQIYERFMERKNNA